MARKVRKHVGSFVVTGEADLDPRGITCAECGKLLASNDPENDCTHPSPEGLMAMGAVAVPNFGWFCGQKCGDHYEQATGIKFARNSRGQIAYYESE